MNRQHNNKIMKTKSQSGVSLVELMISMVVGLFLLAGVVSNFISTKNSDVKRDAVSEMDGNAAEAFRILRRSISHAGYRSFDNALLDDDMGFYIDNAPVSNASCSNGFQRDKWQVPANRRTRDGSSKDFLTVISLADNPCLDGNTSCIAGSGNEEIAALFYTDCAGGGNLRDAHTVSCSTDRIEGMSRPSDAKIYSSFWLVKNTTSGEDRTLYCGGSRSNPQPIINDVESIQYLYGVKNDAGSITFRKANKVTSANQWPMVVSVQVGLLMRSSNNSVLDVASSKLKYNILNQNVLINAADSRRLFRVYTTTINIQNRQTDALL